MHLDFIDDQVEKMLQAGVIEPSSSHASNGEKDGAYCCIC